LEATRRFSRPALAVVICLIAGILETVLFIAAVHPSEPNWAAALAVSRMGIATSAICFVSSIVGLFRKPRPLAILVPGLVVGFFGLWFTLAVEALSHSSGLIY
jgi:hypothetical protein